MRMTAKQTKGLEPQQERSRESLRKLLKAALEVLGQRGLKGATIPRIAHHAGLTPGAVYRRFPDKDALLEQAILGILERQDEMLRASLPVEMAHQIPLPVLADQVINSMVISYRAKATLLSAIRHFAQSRINSPFSRKADKLEKRTLEYLVSLFLTHRKDIGHPEPKTAITLALLMAMSALTELFVYTCDGMSWRVLLPTDDVVIKRELVRAFLSYLQVEQKPPR